MQKKMWKVITSIERRDGTKFWMRLGRGFTNKDDSINLYLDAVPVGVKELQLQLREVTEEDLRESAAKRAAFAARASTNNTTPNNDSLPF